VKDPTKPEIKPIEPKPVILNPLKTAFLVLEISQHVEDPEYFGSPIVPGVTKLLEKARAAGVLTVFTVPLPFKGTYFGQVYQGLQRRPCEPVFSPPAFDKWGGGQLRTLLSLYEEIDTLLIVGCKANMAILITATRAVTEYNYNLVIPVDGIAAPTEYEKEYTLYEFRAYPAGFPKKFTFTKMDMIDFK
jgi:nicotinamidase-related amidase